MAGIFTSIGEKLGLRGGGDKIQYLLAGTLVLVIIISLIAAITTFSGKKGRGSGELRYYDIETGKEFTLTKKELNKQLREGIKEGIVLNPRAMRTTRGARVINPDTGQRTGVPMTNCLKCEEWFVPDFLLNEEIMESRIICPHCQTDQSDYRREQRMGKKKKNR